MDRARRTLLLLVFACALAAPVLIAGTGRALDPLRHIVFDAYQRAAPRLPPADLPALVADIDDESLARLGQWPWPRTLMADLAGRLVDLGAAAVAFDMVWSEPDRASPSELLMKLPETPARAALAEAFGPAADHDGALARALEGKPIVVGRVFIDRETPVRAAKAAVAVIGAPETARLPTYPGVVDPLPVIAEAAAGLGALNWLPDRDQTIRRVPLLARVGGALAPSLSVEALRVAQGASTLVFRTGAGEGGGAAMALRIGAVEVATAAEGEMTLRYAAADPRRYEPVWRILAGQTPRERIEGRIVIVGASAAALGDRRATPLAAAVPGVEIHVQAIEHMIEGSPLVRPDWAPGAEAVAGFLGALAAGLAVVLAPPLLAAMLISLLVAGGAAAGFLLFDGAGLLFDPLSPILAALLVFALATLAQIRATQNARRYVQTAFSRYVSPAVVERLVREPARMALGGEERVLTVLFCDLRDFTTLSEGMDPQSLTRFMNRYLSRMSEVILAEGGTIDKYVGDAIVAFWNAPLDVPDHPARALAAARGMIAALDRLNAERAAEGATHRARCGVGLSTGLCCVGNLGSEQRFDYSALGDTVNIAARLEGLTKAYRVDVLVAGSTRDALKDQPFLALDAIRVKGKAQETRLYTPWFDSAAPPPALAEAHERLHARRAAGDADGARAAAKDALAHAPERLRGYYERMAEAPETVT